MNEYDSAEKYYRDLLKKLPPNDPSLPSLYYKYGLLIKEKGDYDSSLQWFHKSLEMSLRTTPSDYINIAGTYCCIGDNHQMKGDYNEALNWYNKRIELFKYGKFI
ncbi:unnamed protein product [Adineta steineri]|uniref:Tetratricopeptide repeat protein n=1 Tax=Adineta steineri TaxID=433720 RepID=A0A818SAX1_9BILA|nr:unnamed protein product [Adineta steineri]CAF3664403.1 unnamed protein product [Adineta steineri]